MLKQLYDALFPNDDIIFINKNSNNVKFVSSGMVILSVDLD